MQLRHGPLETAADGVPLLPSGPKGPVKPPDCKT